MSINKTQTDSFFIRIKKSNPFNFAKFISEKNQTPEFAASKQILNTAEANLAKISIQNDANLTEIENTLVPKFKTLNKIDFEDAEIYTGLVADPTSKNGLRYVIIEPQLNKHDVTNFRVIKKLLISELDISLNNIKTKKRQLKN
ncbi:hypothetical protein [Candidatus Nitrosotenuis sp. DW1]|uniref:hypothetical protein n=1 Tax=Candidatus Nitrosotenuis sp. DW1 TaxID=2259672 RepID=UPI002104D737|nr:hypothetical protein [Candidatus Nitrosotenuis sp. DW1]